jgi:MraZ protein
MDPEASQASPPPLAPPRGIYPARVDDRGRLKLPVPFQQYLNGLPEKKLFATSMDRRTARIYPVFLWRETENKLRSARGGESGPARRVIFTANELGADTEMDNQGRVLLSPELRRELGMENQGVRILAEAGRIDVMTEATFEERQREARESPQADVSALEMAGLV